MKKTYKDLLDYIQEIPNEEKRDEATTLVLKSASDSITLKKLKKLLPEYERKIAIGEKEEKSYIKFTPKEISQMPNGMQQLFIVDNHVVRYRFYRGM